MFPMTKRLTPAKSQRGTNTWEILHDEQDHQHDNVARPQSVTAAATEHNENAEEHTVDYRKQIQTNNHRDDSHDEAHLYSSTITMHKCKAINASIKYAYDNKTMTTENVTDKVHIYWCAQLKSALHESVQAVCTVNLLKTATGNSINFNLYDFTSNQ